MNIELLQALVVWRKKIAQRDGFRELYRIFSNSTLEELARKTPQNEYELLNIKGIGQKKCERYSKDILKLVKETTFEKEDVVSQKEKYKEDYATKEIECVGDFLDRLNQSLGVNRGRVRGEITSLQWRETCVYFSLKDAEKDAILPCFMWSSDLLLFGLNLSEGMEIIALGVPNIYKPVGKMTFRVSDIELVGEGALKMAYEALKKKLEIEGLLDEKRKKKLPEFPRKVGIITSLQGAVIHDFLNNVSHYGFRFFCRDTRVEGQSAVRDLLQSLRVFKNQDIDILVVMRGGGSLESLQAFNNEILIRELATMPFPVVAAIGHHQDMPLFALVSDSAVSTPTAAAHILGECWNSAKVRLLDMEHSLFSFFEIALERHHRILDRSGSDLEKYSTTIIERITQVRRALYKCSLLLEARIQILGKEICEGNKRLFTLYEMILMRTEEKIVQYEKSLSSHDPKRMLALGYSLIRKDAKIIRSVEDVCKNEELEITMYNGKIITQVKNITYEGKK
ncbi:MAG: exodeoxyribonuclease VII large subunit [Candidatus Moraniibacteriota bacterium]|nr:MAG: exodeoxyribonuclease VII large subunit [Candidatus Moranbacteria bacterium]